MTMQRCRRVSKEQNMETTKGFSAKVRMSLSTKACWIWFLRIRFCLLIFFMANRWRVSRCRTRYTALAHRHITTVTFPFMTSVLICAQAGLTDVRMNHFHVNTSSVSGVIGSTHPYAPLLISLMVWKSASPGGFIALILPCRSKVTRV